MKGTIYTFYSFKGGVGRSMALANIGTYFYRQGYKTLLIDFDLEAPGLERYFESRYKLNLRKIQSEPGLMDMLRDYMLAVSRPAPDDGELPYPAIEKYIHPIDGEAPQLLLMHAGKRGEGQDWI